MKIVSVIFNLVTDHDSWHFQVWKKKYVKIRHIARNSQKKKQRYCPVWRSIFLIIFPLALCFFRFSSADLYDSCIGFCYYFSLSLFSLMNQNYT